MKLKLELDLENPAASMVYLDDRRIGGMHTVSFMVDIERNVFLADVKGFKRRDAKEKDSWTFGAPQKISASVCGSFLGPQSEWTQKQAIALVDALQANLSKK